MGGDKNFFSPVQPVYDHSPAAHGFHAWRRALVQVEDVVATGLAACRTGSQVVHRAWGQALVKRGLQRCTVRVGTESGSGWGRVRRLTRAAGEGLGTGCLRGRRDRACRVACVGLARDAAIPGVLAPPAPTIAG